MALIGLLGGACRFHYFPFESFLEILKALGVYTVQGTLNKEQHELLVQWLKRQISGPDNSSNSLILDRGATWTPQGMTGVDAQHLETRRHQVEEICRAYGVFPIMVGHSDKTATFASSEAFFAAHLKHTLAPWHRAWTQRIDEMLLDGAGPLFAEFDTRYLQAGSMKDRAVWARTMAEIGIYTRNELRDEEGKAPLPGLDDPMQPMNMTEKIHCQTRGSRKPGATSANVRRSPIPSLGDAGHSHRAGTRGAGNDD